MIRLAGKIAVVVGAGQSPARGSAMPARRGCASRRKDRKSLQSTATLSRPMRPPWRPQSLVANAAPSLLLTSVALPVRIFGAWDFAENGLLRVPDGPLRGRRGWYRRAEALEPDCLEFGIKRQLADNRASDGSSLPADNHEAHPPK
jgi:hypothetical protein